MDTIKKAITFTGSLTLCCIILLILSADYVG